MTSARLLTLALASLTTPCLVLAAPAGLLPNQIAASTTSSSTGASPSYVSDALVCGTTGYTENGHDNLISPVLGPETLADCRAACADRTDCQSISWADIGVCYIYAEPMHCDHLLEDQASMYAYYDKDCPYPRNLAVGGEEE